MPKDTNTTPWWAQQGGTTPWWEQHGSTVVVAGLVEDGVFCGSCGGIFDASEVEDGLCEHCTELHVEGMLEAEEEDFLRDLEEHADRFNDDQKLRF